MNEIDILIAEIRAEIVELEAQLKEALAIKAANEAEGNPLWGDPDENGARVFLPMENLRQEWLASGDRAKEFCAVEFDYFHKNNFLVPLGDTIPDNIKEAHAEAVTKSLGMFMLGVNPGAVETDVPGVYVYVEGSKKNAAEAREGLEANWTDEGFIQQEYFDAVRKMAKVDRAFRLAILSDREEAFWQKYPHYKPKKT